MAQHNVNAASGMDGRHLTSILPGGLGGWRAGGGGGRRNGSSRGVINDCVTYHGPMSMQPAGLNGRHLTRILPVYVCVGGGGSSSKQSASVTYHGQQNIDAVNAANGAG
jgi:hypothetical protein